MGFTSSAKESRTRVQMPVIFKCRSSINPNFQSMLLCFFFFFFFFPLSGTIYIFKYQPGLKITSEEGLGSYQEPRITLSILPPFQTSSISSFISIWDSPETDSFLTLPSSVSREAHITTGCFVPDSMVTNDHVTAILETLLQNIYDQATARNTWTHSCVSGFHFYPFPESKPQNSCQLPPPILYFPIHWEGDRSWSWQHLRPYNILEVSKYRNIFFPVYFWIQESANCNQNIQS